ncbi:MAG: hypothetical protein JOS17DRAFT_797412 [Linnemannia elongata]|nr:MAG: hypothetical protein JOS17DRAFT_797412 [Linnemannia elongata]
MCDTQTSYSPVRPLVIALVVILILSLILTCIRRRRAIALRQQQLLQQQHNPTTELGDVAYIYQYPPPPGTPSNTYQSPSGAGQSMYAPPPGASPLMSQYPGGGGGGYYPPMAGHVVDMDGQQQQSTPGYSHTHAHYPPMPVAPSPTAATGTSSTGGRATTYVAAQDGSANLTNADIHEGVPAIPPPPYTATVPK